MFFFGDNDTASSDTTTTQPTATTQPTDTETTSAIQPTSTTQPEETEPIAPESDAGIPEAADEMVDQIRSAAEAGDLDTLADLALEGRLHSEFRS